METKTEVKNVENKITDSNAFVKETDYADEITKIKNDYTTKANLDSKINDLKSQRIADEVKKVDDKAKKNSTDIFNTKTSLELNKSVINDLEREPFFSRDFFNNLTFFLNQILNHLVEMVELLIVGFQQRSIMTVKTLTCFL